MKKLFVVLICVCAFSLNIIAQKNDKCVKQGSILVDGYYGLINPYNIILKGQVIIDYNTPTDFSTSNVGPIGVKAEYLVSNLIGLGVDANYTNTTLTFKQEIGNGAGGYTNQLYTWNAVSTHAFVSVAFHYLKKEKFDMYSAIKFGYFTRTTTRTPVDPYRFNPQYSITPIGFRIETGVRYFIIPNLGIHASVGIGVNGGQVFGVGLSGNF